MKYASNRVQLGLVNKTALQALKHYKKVIGLKRAYTYVNYKNECCIVKFWNSKYPDVYFACWKVFFRDFNGCIKHNSIVNIPALNCFGIIHIDDKLNVDREILCLSSPLCMLAFIIKSDDHYIKMLKKLLNIHQKPGSNSYYEHMTYNPILYVSYYDEFIAGTHFEKTIGKQYLDLLQRINWELIE